MWYKKLQFILFFWLVCILGGKVNANTQEPSMVDTQHTMTWPMLPNESLTELAVKFYPRSKAMQRHFIQKTLQLNKNNQTITDANTRYTSPTAIVIPSLKSLSAKAPKLRFSYNIKSTPKPKQETSVTEQAVASVKNIPQTLVNEYERLVKRNNFLKEEIAKLNERLAFLQNKLGELKLIWDKTLTMPPKPKKIKNLDAAETTTKSNQAQAASQTPDVLNQVQPEKKSFFDIGNKLLWLGLLLMGLLLALTSYLYKKYLEKRYTNLVEAISHQKPAGPFDTEQPDQASEQEALIASAADTVVEEYSGQTIMREAKTMHAKSQTNEAIGHLKWAIKAKPKLSITVWLYLLELLRIKDAKDDFERFALEMHQNFNVMTPLWENKEVPMVVSQSLEEFPYIMEMITKKWPNPKIINYLQKLISDNRDGERSGFSQAVIEDIILLIDVLETLEAESATLETA